MAEAGTSQPVLMSARPACALVKASPVCVVGALVDLPSPDQPSLSPVEPDPDTAPGIATGDLDLHAQA
jgi:hypothetical protein